MGKWPNRVLIQPTGVKAMATTEELLDQYYQKWTMVANQRLEISSRSIQHHVCAQINKLLKTDTPFYTKLFIGPFMDGHSRENGNQRMLAPRIDFGMTVQGRSLFFTVTGRTASRVRVSSFVTLFLRNIRETPQAIPSIFVSFRI